MGQVLQSGAKKSQSGAGITKWGKITNWGTTESKGYNGSKSYFQKQPFADVPQIRCS